MKATKPDGRWQQPTGISPLHSSCSPTHCLRRSERSDFDGKGVSACLYVMAHKQPRLHCGMVMIAPLFREKHRGAPTARLDTDSNVSVCPMMHRHYPAGIFFKVHQAETRKGEDTFLSGSSYLTRNVSSLVMSFVSSLRRSSSSTQRWGLPYSS